MGKVGVNLMDADLWSAFHQRQNEMIITRAGRCLFPLFRIEITGNPGQRELEIDPEHDYVFLLGIERVDRMRWKYRQAAWQPVLSASTPAVANLIPAEQEDVHLCPAQESPKRGSHLAQMTWCQVKVSNRNTGRSSLYLEESGANHPHLFILHSFVRYRPVVLVVDRTLLNSTSLNVHSSAGIQRLSWEETTFIAVTHYQNVAVTNLKKSLNPHAKGFLVAPSSPSRGSHEVPSSSSLQKRRKRSHPSDQSEYEASMALQEMQGHL